MFVGTSSRSYPAVALQSSRTDGVVRQQADVGAVDDGCSEDRTVDVGICVRVQKGCLLSRSSSSARYRRGCDIKLPAGCRGSQTTGLAAFRNRLARVVLSPCLAHRANPQPTCTGLGWAHWVLAMDGASTAAGRRLVRGDAELSSSAAKHGRPLGGGNGYGVEGNTHRTRCFR